MTENRLATIVLGLNRRGQDFLEAADSTGMYDIKAVADTDITLAEKAASGFQCSAFDDYRQLITAMDSKLEPENRVLLVAAEMHSCDEYIRLAMKKKFNIIKLAPAARDFEEAAKFAHIAEEQDVRYVIANPVRYAENFIALKDLLKTEGIEHIFLIRAYCTFSNSSHTISWQNDPKLAGGGVLLYDCYQILDQIVLNFGMPEQVYSLQTNQAQDKRQRSYLTEDTALVTMKFSDAFLGSLIASRRNDIGPPQEILTIYGKDRIVEVSAERMVVRNGSGKIVRRMKCRSEPADRVKEFLKHFALCILKPDENKISSTARENMYNMAVMEAAYLSARTGFPETPAKILQLSPETAV